ncbi:MAG: hypothetical protein JRE23_00040 [Deltaproteobacteria bacterium]|nr:hypothetical protein [Deltaproteobacteria bacterium]
MKETTKISLRNHAVIDQSKQDNTVSKALSNDGVRRCPQCKAPRKGAKCWKCGEATFEPCEGWEEPKLPPIDLIRELAYEVGYAIGEHGSKERDLDVIAAPWTKKAVDPIDLLLHLKNGLNGKLVGGIENKPLGRVGANIQLDGFYKVIDISVYPKV